MGEWTVKSMARIGAVAGMMVALGACSLFDPQSRASSESEEPVYMFGSEGTSTGFTGASTMPAGAVPLAPAVSSQLQKGDLGDMSVVVSDQGTQYSLGRPYTSALGFTCRPFLSVNQDNGVFRKTAACSDGSRWFAIPPVLLSQGD